MAVLTGSNNLELSHAFAGEAVPDVTQEVAALGFGSEEVLVIVIGELEVSIDVSAAETQVQDAQFGIVCDREKHLRFKR